MDIDNHQEVDPLTDSLLDNIIDMSESGNKGSGKRKSDEATQREGKENSSIEKKAKTEHTTGSQSSKPLVELKGRKFIYNEEAAPWSVPKRRLLLFDMVLLDHEEGDKTLNEIPTEFYDIVGMVGHEHSAATEATLVKAIRTALSPRATHLIPANVVTPLISKLFTQKNYGLLPSDFPSTSSNQVKIPAPLQIRRWEAIEPEKYFPAEHHRSLRARQAERERVRAECVRLLGELDDVEARDLIKGEKEEKAEKKEKKRAEPHAVERESVEQSPRVSVARTSREGTAATNDSRRSASPTKKSKMTPEEEEAARLKKEEREAKKAEKAEKKAARDLELQKKEEEKAKQEAVKAKQANMFGSFFKPAPKPVAVAGQSAVIEDKKREATPELSDFHQVFKPHVIRPGTRWAAINKWAGQQGAPKASGSDVSQWSANDFLQDHMARHRHKLNTPRTKLPSGLKSGSCHSTVGEVWAAHQEAADPRKVLSQLRKTHKYPWKLLAFDQQARPPYSGTFTKKSASVGPRTPFAQDPMFDYTYDSGDDWEEDEGGEDVDDFGDAKPEGEDEDVDDEDDEEDDEFADWLDDEDDAGYADMPVDDDEDPLLHAAPASRQGRLPVNPIKKADKPRKIVKVTPWFRGPIWETEIGKHEEFAEYRLQLLNDTPDSFDPFTYTSTEPTQAYKSTMSTISMGLSVIPCLMSTTAINAPPVVATPAASASVSADPSASASTSAGTTSRSRTAPKIAFPASHLYELFNLIHGNTKIQTDLVSQLRQHFETVTSKAAIEAKVREVAVREGKTKDSKWKVKAEAWAAAGLTPPVEAAPSIFVKQTEA